MQTFTPMQYLKIDIASNFGLDKESWDNRIAWTETNIDQLEDFTKQAAEPALFFAAVQAFRAASKGKSISYPISLDATASGAQILALLVGCEKSARLCNVLDTTERGDLYTSLYQSMLDRVGSGEKLSRDEVKKAIMTALYGSVAKPKEIFGEGDMLLAFFETMETDATGIWMLNQELLSLWKSDQLSHDWILPDNFHVKVKVMDFVEDSVHFMDRPYGVIRKENVATETGRSLGANIVHSIDGMIVREMGRRCSFDLGTKAHAMEVCLSHIKRGYVEDPEQANSANCKMVRTLAEHHEETGFLSARMIDYIDSYSIVYAPAEALWALLEAMPSKPFPMLSIHDCFRVHPNYGNDLRRQYNQVLYELAKSKLLKGLVSQINGYETNVTKFDHFSTDVLETNYALS